jgi:hypothetical protein
LITGDFFARLRLFKESISELFFAPSVTAAAIECNVRIGNAYINLIHLEREKMHEESLESKYGDLNEQAVSDAAARTLKLVDLLRGPAAADEGDIEVTQAAPLRVSPWAESPAPVEEPKLARELPPFVARLRESIVSVNKLFLAFSLLLMAGSIGVWVWANYVVSDRVASSGVETVNLQGTFMNEYIKTARVSTGNFYGVLEPTWETLSKEKRLEFARKVLQFGEDKGFSQVSLISKDGKMAAFASASRVEVLSP